MKIPFPSYQTTFTCDCTMQEVTKKIQDCVAQNPKEMKIKKSEYDGIQRFVIETSTGSVFMHNSFSPAIYISLSSLGGKTGVNLIFELPKYAKLFTRFYICSCLVFAVFMFLDSIIKNEYADFLWNFLPVVFCLYCYFLSLFGLRLSSQGKLKLILQSLDYHYNGKDFLPQLQRVKFFNSKKE